MADLDMLIQTQSTFFYEAGEDQTLINVWAIDLKELCAHGKETLKYLESSQFPAPDKLKNSIWTTQAILEFQDLQSATLPQRGPFFNMSYLFFEAISALREATVCGLNTLYHSSFSNLRVALEMFTFHYWWQNRLSQSDSYEEFYEWLTGKQNSAPFSNMISDIYAEISLPSGASSKDGLLKTYRALCSYSHKPLIKESITTIRAGNLPGFSPEVFLYWLETLASTQRCLLDLAIAYHPQAMFPVCIYRKFGFNPPIGVLLDDSNFVPIKEALGKILVDEYKSHYCTEDKCEQLLKWFNSLTDLTDKEILSTWTEDLPQVNHTHSIEENIKIMWAHLKANMRTTLQMYAYIQKEHSIEVSGDSVIITMDNHKGLQ